MKKNKKKESKTLTERIQSADNASKRSMKAKKTSERVENVITTINRTLFAKGEYLVDNKNFSVISATQPKDLY